MAGLIGQHLGQYEIIGLLGEGGMATVYRARQANIKRDVAIKVIRHNLAEKGEFLTRFEREAQTSASLSHPFILKVFDYGQQGDLVYLVMELLTGGTLANLIRQGPMPSDTASRMFDQVASALDFAHQKGIIHRDLKPQNVLLDEAGNAHLSDFGIVKLMSEGTVLTQTGMSMGTPSYMSPEQWQGKPLDTRSDLYALGVMLFEMLAGTLPFVADTPFGLMHMHVYNPPPALQTLRPDLPPAVGQVIEKALAKDPDDRYQSGSQLVAAFKAALAGQTVPTAALPPSRTRTRIPDATAGETILEPRLDAPARSRRTLVGIGIAAVAVVAAGVLAAALLGRPATNADPSATQTVPQTATGAVALAATATGVTPTALPATAAATVPAVVAPTATQTTTANRPTATPLPTTAAPTATSTATVTNTNTAVKPTITPSLTATTVPPTNTPTPTTAITPSATATTAAQIANPTAPPVTGAVTAGAPGDTRRDARAISQVKVPAGCFLMGSSPAKDKSSQPNEQPQHEVCLTHAYWIDAYEVTNAAYQQFVADGGYTKREFWSDAGWQWVQKKNIDGPEDYPNFNDPQQPRIGVSWYEADAYARWRGGHLPTEAQWEFSARGPQSPIYPWGDTWYATKANTSDGGSVATMLVGSYPAGKSWVGAFDMAGNVWEWTSDWYDADYYRLNVKNDPIGPATGTLHALRGGTWNGVPQYARTAYRYRNFPDGRYNNIGFRVVSDQ